jgi:uncharacterized protein (DUF1697 family)
VRTLLNSGNAVFTGPKAKDTAIAEQIEEAMSRKLGVSAKITVLTQSELEAVVRAMPLSVADRDPARMMVGFFRTPADERRIDPVLAQKWAPEEVATGPRVVYVWCPRGILESPAYEAIGAAAGDGITARNWSTVTKLLAMVRPV